MLGARRHLFQERQLPTVGQDSTQAGLRCNSSNTATLRKTQRKAMSTTGISRVRCILKNQAVKDTSNFTKIGNKLLFYIILL